MGRFTVRDSVGGFRVIDLGQQHLVRIFNGNFEKGGRLYRGFWLQMGGRMRACLRINGEAVYEYDFSACHIRLLYAAIGVPCLPKPYQIHGFESARGIVKHATLVMINASSEGAARKAVVRKMREKGIPGGEAYASQMMAAIKTRLPEIEQFWYRGVGKQLQRCDSDIMIRCLTELLDQQIVGLPVHDSIVVQKQHEQTLIEVMDRIFETEGEVIAIQLLSHLANKPRRDRRRAGIRNQDLTATTATRETKTSGICKHDLTVMEERVDGLVDQPSASSVPVNFSS
ncbi:MAG: hypothetical protein ABL901_02570 [Hyphomicrobiaceae bacterium]